MGEPTGPVNRAALFQQVRWQMWRNGARAVSFSTGVKSLTILFGSLLIWGCVFAGAWDGFHFLHRVVDPYNLEELIATVFNMLFLALAFMLVISGGLILYSSLFSAAETNFLLSMPVPADQVFAYKFQAAVAFSSWAFILLGFPVLIAYGVVFEVPWYFYALLPLFTLGFVLVPGSLGALLCLLVVHYLPRRRKQVLILVGVVLLLGLGLWARSVIQDSQSKSWTRDTIKQLLSPFAFAQVSLLPSNWMTRGLQATASGDLGEAGYRLALVWSNGLFLYLVTAWTARRLYRRAYNRVATGGSLRRRYGGAWLDGTLSTLLGFLNPQTRLLIVKDFRTFRRDPAQWVQIVIFTGLLTLYFANTHRFWQEEMSRPYQNGISLLNLGSIGLLMCAYTGRFIYPLLSLEGRKFWVLGLLPLQRDRLLWGKFAFSTTGALVISEFLVLVSDWMMTMPPFAIALHALTVAVLAFGLSGLSVGLGAWLPNFRESDPSKIAVGFGGTLNLIFSLLLLLLVVSLMAGPWHVAAAIGEDTDLADIGLDSWVALGLLAGLLLGAAAVVVPLRFGGRALRGMEF